MFGSPSPWAAPERADDEPWRLPPLPGVLIRGGTTIGVAALLMVLGVGLEMPLCLTAATYGIPCPGCGMTRAAVELLHGDVGGALHFHPLAPVIVPVYVGILAVGAGRWVLGVRLPAGPKSLRRVASVAGGALVAALVTVWIARFAGHLGGPVPVETLPGWAHRQLTR